MVGLVQTRRVTEVQQENNQYLVFFFLRKRFVCHPIKNDFKTRNTRSKFASDFILLYFSSTWFFKCCVVVVSLMAEKKIFHLKYTPDRNADAAGAAHKRHHSLQNRFVFVLSFSKYTSEHVFAFRKMILNRYMDVVFGRSKTHSMLCCLHNRTICIMQERLHRKT